MNDEHEATKAIENMIDGVVDQLVPGIKQTALTALARKLAAYGETPFSDLPDDKFSLMVHESVSDALVVCTQLWRESYEDRVDVGDVHITDAPVDPDDDLAFDLPSLIETEYKRRKHAPLDLSNDVDRGIYVEIMTRAEHALRQRFAKYKGKTLTDEVKQQIRDELDEVLHETFDTVISS